MRYELQGKFDKPLILGEKSQLKNIQETESV